MSWHKEPAQEFQEVTTAKDRSITIWFCMHAIYTEHSFPHSLVPDISGDRHSGNNALQLEDSMLNKTLGHYHASVPVKE